MLKERNQDEILEYFNEKINGDMAKFQLSRIYYMAKDEQENREKKNKLIEIAKIKRYEIIREVIIDEYNAVFETKDSKNEKMYTIVVINGSRSTSGYYTLEQGLVGWICEKQGYSDVAWHLFRMLDIKNKVD
jgi:hypothetical protein